jgi:hypothetical protein
MRFADRRLAAVLIAALWPLAAAAGDLSRVAADGFESRLWIEVNTPEIVVQPGETGVVCYHFLFPIGSTRGVRRWSSTLGENVHHMVLYTSHDANWAPIPHQPPRTLTASDCGLVSAPSPLGWQYVAHDPTQELAMPDDDGNGQPLAMEFVARQPMLLVLYLPNPTSEPIRGSAILRADLLPPDAPYTRTATYLSFNANIAIPPMSLGSSVSATCAAPVHAHAPARHAVRAARRRYDAGVVLGLGESRRHAIHCACLPRVQPGRHDLSLHLRQSGQRSRPAGR